jgi:hypothetical protein
MLLTKSELVNRKILMNSEINFDDVMNRLKSYTNAKSFNALADMLGLSSSNFANLKKRNSIPYDKILEFSNSHNVSMDWLLTGEGTMLKGGVSNDERFSEEDLQILRMIKRLPPTQKNYQVKNIEVFLQSADEYARHILQTGELRMAA